MPGRRRKRKRSIQRELKRAEYIRARLGISTPVQGIDAVEEIHQPEIPTNNNAGPDLIPSLCEFINRKNALQGALKYLTRTKIEGSTNEHQACVCAVCDCFIIGTEKICYLLVEQLLEKSSYLDVNYLESMTNKKLPPVLRNQYKVENCERLSSLLLSPRAPKKDNNYMSCETCWCNVSREKNTTPPKFGISNAWAIGYIPHDVVGDIDDMLAVMVNKIRLFSYIFSYSGGAHKSIQGHHTFF